MIKLSKDDNKISKKDAGYVEFEQFKNSDLKAGYFCFNCVFWIKPDKCKKVKEDGPDSILKNESGKIASYGCCNAWYPDIKIIGGEK